LKKTIVEYLKQGKTLRKRGNVATALQAESTVVSSSKQEVDHCPSQKFLKIVGIWTVGIPFLAITLLLSLECPSVHTITFNPCAKPGML